jgi:hypothetical protein
VANAASRKLLDERRGEGHVAVRGIHRRERYPPVIPVRSF